METWKALPGFEGLYECSDKGRVKNVCKRRGSRPNKLLNPYLSTYGYRQVALRKDGAYHKRYVHRLVMEAFVGASSLEVNHKNGKKTDNRIGNLEYVTTKENLMHACRTLGVRRGANHWNARLTEADAIEIHKLGRAGVTHAEIAKRFGLKRASVTGILTGRQWAYLFTV